jgi:hypothetical protein
MLDVYPAELKAFVLGKIASGEFKSADEFAIEAAALYREMDRRRELIRQQVAEGIAQIDAGEYIEIKGDEQLRDFFEGVKRRGRERLKNESDLQ